MPVVKPEKWPFQRFRALDIRIGYARCPTLGQELDSQLDARSKHGIPRDKIFSE
ncbi:hypothetical protein ACFRFL_36455 [Streptomyces sp. NPDC056708]|uniref:hypothetical protein n=1 Tax=unclassified Streptomyces TaxID=2593676 RepID=UPI00368BA5D3